MSTVSIGYMRMVIDTQNHNCNRWALLVTFDELDALVDEILAGETGMTLSPQEAQHIKEGRAMLFIDRVPVLPELPPQQTQALNG
jgi:hypothetical protein